MQSHHGEIYLLPALPDVWETGKIYGLKARGNVEVAINWEAGNLTEATLISKKD